MLSSLINWKKYLRPIIALTLLVLIFKLGLIDLDQLKSSLQNPLILISGLLFFTSHTLMMAFRWKIVVGLEIIYPYAAALRQTFIGNFFNFFIPSGVGGDIVKALSLSEAHKVTKKKSFSLIAIDRVIGLFCLILFSTLFLLFEYIMGMPASIVQLFQISLVLLAIAISGLLFLYHSKKILPHITNKLQNKDQKKLRYRLISKLISFAQQLQSNIEKALHYRFLIRFILVSLIIQCLSIGFLYTVTTLLTQQSISFLIFLPLACFAFMASAVPLTPAGIGVGQAAFYFIFSTINIPTAVAVTTAISLTQFFMLIVSLPGGYFFATSRKMINEIIQHEGQI